MLQAEPMLAVADVVAAAEYYRDKLGFTIRVIWGEPPFYSIVDRGSISINFVATESVLGEEGERGGAYITVEDVDAMHAELLAKDVKLWSLPEDREYGMRDFIAIDCNGYRLCFGEPIK